MRLTSRRVLVVAVGALALVVLGAAACKPDRPPRPPGSTGTSITGPRPIDCGTLAYGWGPPDTGPVAGRPGVSCLLDAFAAGTPARFVTTDSLDNLGRRVGTVVYEVLGAGLLRVTTGDLVQRCTGLATSAWDGPSNVLLPGNCTPQPPAEPPLAGTHCGSIAYASGWPTTMVVSLEFGVGKCFLDAWAAGTPARLVTRDQTDGEGYHIRITIYDVLGTGQLRVITDNRQARDAGGITTERCTTLTASYSRLVPGNCTPA